MKKTTFLPAVASAKAGALLLFSFLLFTACNNDKKQIEALITSTTELHDNAMKDLADMNRVARELKQTIAAATMTPEQSALYTTALESMGKAENDMMEWMKNYKLQEDMPAADKIKYLQEQKALIEKNGVEIKAALETGKKLMEK